MHKILFSGKKSAVNVFLLVIVALVLCIASLFIFLTQQNKLQESISGIKVIGESYSEWSFFELYLSNLAKDTITDNPGSTSENFVDRFITNYMAKAPAEYMTDDIKSQIQNKSKYEVKINAKQLDFELKDFKFSEKPGLSETQNIGLIEYTKDITFNVKLN